MLVWEDPMTAALTLTKTTPRSWLQAGERLAVRNAPTSHGRVSFNISSALTGEKPAVDSPPPDADEGAVGAVKHGRLLFRRPNGAR